MALTKNLQKKVYFNGQQLSAIGFDNSPQDTHLGGDEAFDKSLQLAVLGAKKEVLSAGDTDKTSTEAEGSRTLNLRIDSPML